VFPYRDWDMTDEVRKLGVRWSVYVWIVTIAVLLINVLIVSGISKAI